MKRILVISHYTRSVLSYNGGRFSLSIVYRWWRGSIGVLSLLNYHIIEFSYPYYNGANEFAFIIPVTTDLHMQTITANSYNAFYSDRCRYDGRKTRILVIPCSSSY